MLGQRYGKKIISLDGFLEILEKEKPHRNPGTAIYMSSSLLNAPYALINTYEHFKTVHEQIIFLRVVTEGVPHIERAKHLEVKSIGHGCHTIVIHYGYMDDPDIPEVVDKLKVGDRVINSGELSYFIGKENLFATEIVGMAIWREKLFALLSANSADATTYFKLPRHRVMEVGIQIEL